MIKKISIALVVSFLAGYALLHLIFNNSRMDWGHHFSFENELGFEIDSLEISVGGLITVIYAASDSLSYLEGNIVVPREGYPHEVFINIYSKEKSMLLKADSFNCYNCDGNHEYILKPSGAEYNFYN